jgi:sucrose-6-phosphate hydrolase SacC (GH32 family)
VPSGELTANVEKLTVVLAIQRALEHNLGVLTSEQNYGKDYYCAISFNGPPDTERPVLLGWMSNWQYAAKLPTSPWRGQMSLPRRLCFLKDGAGLALKQDPVVDTLRGKSIVVSEEMRLSEEQTRALSNRGASSSGTAKC